MKRACSHIEIAVPNADSILLQHFSANLLNFPLDSALRKPRMVRRSLCRWQKLFLLVQNLLILLILLILLVHLAYPIFNFLGLFCFLRLAYHFHLFRRLQLCRFNCAG
ncbi:hypothetical protein D3C77_314850 [compost metagenome]